MAAAGNLYVVLEMPNNSLSYFGCLGITNYRCLIIYKNVSPTFKMYGQIGTYKLQIQILRYKCITNTQILQILKQSSLSKKILSVC